MKIPNSIRIKAEKHALTYSGYSLETRLLQFFVILQLIWATANGLFGLAVGLPCATICAYFALVIGLVVFGIVAYFTHTSHYLERIYFPLALVAFAFLWYYSGGSDAAGNILFVCEIVLFVMCLRGRRQLIYLLIALASTGFFSIQYRVNPTIFKFIMSEEQIGKSSSCLGCSTCILIAMLLVRQKKEYARERDRAINSEKELEMSNHLQKNFLANMSHEIRSPLGIVLGFNSLILDSKDPEVIHEYSRNIERAGYTLTTVINDILDYSKIESGKLDIIEAPFSFEELIADIRTDIELKSSEKGLRFEVHVSKDIPNFLVGDSIRIKQCILNLLSNAVKYTDTGIITLNAFLDEPVSEGKKCRIRIDVADTGRGIAQEAIPNLFTAFQRLDEGHNRGIEGTGLGLSIVKNLMDEMGGNVSVVSKKGEGSTFTLIFTQEICEDYHDPVGEKKNAISLEGVKILAVDDTPMNLTLINKLLSKEGAIVTCIDNGDDCLENCKNNTYDLILLDHMMPGMDGIETFTKLRSTEGLNQSTPVIMLTANAMAGAKKEYTDLGFEGYVSKPIVMDKLMGSIAEAMTK